MISVKSTVLFLTFNCNNWCPYCWQRQAQKHGKFAPEPFIPSEKWVIALNRLNIKTLDISGGEPFIQPNFFELIAGLNCERIAITTNLTGDITQFVQKVDPRKVFSITASFHPTGKMQTEEFMGKLLLLKFRGFMVTVNFVSYPEQMYLIPMLQKQFQALGFNFHVDPYAQTEFFPYEFSKDEKDFLQIYVGADRQGFFAEDAKDHRLCSGGRTHLNIQPNGDAYRCISDKVEGLPMVGNIFEPDFVPHEDDKPCFKYTKCSGCDKDKVILTEPRVLV